MTQLTTIYFNGDRKIICKTVFRKEQMQIKLECSNSVSQVPPVLLPTNVGDRK